MPRYRQVINEDGSSTFVEICQSRSGNHSAAVQGDIETFVSPVDGSVISDRKQLREHNLRNNVVSADEFSKEFYDSKAKERERHYTEGPPPEQRQQTRQHIYDQWIRAERNER